MLLCLLIPVVHGATAADLANAMSVPGSDVVSATTTGVATAYDVLTNLGILSPTDGHDFAYLYTGQVGIPPEIGTDLGAPGVPGDRTGLQLELTVPATANSFTFDFNFLSAEYPEFVGTQYNDTFQAQITGTAWNGNAAIDSSGNDITINSALFTVTAPQDLQGTGFDFTGGSTGWLTAVVPVDPLDTVTLNFLVYDVSDGIYDSAVMLDAFSWSAADVDEPVIVEDITLDFLTPKRGPIAGGQDTTIVGTGFSESCVSYFDGVEAPTTFVDIESLIATPPAHAAGLVNVLVDCTGANASLVNGYTYFEEGEGEEAPAIASITPYNVDTAGGEEVEVTGEHFVDGAVVYVDGIEVDAEVIDTGTLFFDSPAHDAGIVDVTVINPSGLADTRSGGLQYLAAASWPPEDTADVDSGLPTDTGERSVPGNKGGSSTGCSTTGTHSPLVAGWFFCLLVGSGLRRRK